MKAVNTAITYLKPPSQVTERAWDVPHSQHMYKQEILVATGGVYQIGNIPHTLANHVKLHTEAASRCGIVTVPFILSPRRTHIISNSHCGANTDSPYRCFRAQLTGVDPTRNLHMHQDRRPCTEVPAEVEGEERCCRRTASSGGRREKSRGRRNGATPCCPGKAYVTACLVPAECGPCLGRACLQDEGV